MLATLSLSGSQSDYQIVPENLGNAQSGLLLLGVTPATKGIAIPLDAYQAIEFSNGVINLAETVWAARGEAKTMPVHLSDEFDQSQALENSSTDEGHIPNGHDSLKIKVAQPITRSPQPGELLNDANQSAHSSKNSHSDDQQDAKTHAHSSAQSSGQGKERSANPSDSQEVGNNKALSSANSSSASPSTSENFNPAYSSTTSVSDDSQASVDYLPKTLFGTIAFDSLQGAEGNDVFYTSSGYDVMKGMGGVDTLVGVNTSAVSIEQIYQGVFSLTGIMAEISETSVGVANYGADISSNLYFSSIEMFKHLDGDTSIELARLASASEFSDVLKPFDDADAWVVDGLAGNDKLVGGRSGDDIKGGAGNDTIDGGQNSIANNAGFVESLDGGDGNDQITYRGFSDVSQAAPSSVIANINGGSGNDLFAVNLDQLSRVNIAGGDGVDTLALQSADGANSVWQANFFEWSWLDQNNQYLLTANDAGHPQTGIFEVSPELEKIALGLSGTGQSYNIVRPQDASPLIMTGTQNADFILAVEGGAVVNAGQGNDIVIASQGSEVSLGAGINELYGTDTDFTLSYEWSSDSVRVDLATQLGMVFDGNGDLLALDRINITPDVLIGSSHDDTLMGDAQDNTMYGGQGADVLMSAGGNDLIFGGEGNDTITFNGDGQGQAEGGLGADAFILDFDFSQASSLTVNDLDFAQGDRVSINLGALTQQANYGSYQVVDTSGSLIFGHEISPDEQAVLNLVLDQDAGVLSFDNGLAQTDFMFVNDGFDGLSAAQLATLINIDYL